MYMRHYASIRRLRNVMKFLENKVNRHRLVRQVGYFVIDVFSLDLTTIGTNVVC